MYIKFRILLNDTVSVPSYTEPLENCKDCNQIKLKRCEDCEKRKRQYDTFASDWILMNHTYLNPMFKNHVYMTASQLSDEIDYLEDNVMNNLLNTSDRFYYLQKLLAMHNFMISMRGTGVEYLVHS